MSATIERLQEDHRRIRNVLAAAQQMAREYQSNNDEDSADHLFCLLDYLAGYPDKVHHPMEEQVFNRALRQELIAEERKALQHNQQQHEQLESATAELNTLFDAVRDSLDMAPLISALEDYSSLQLEHMAFEERETFQIALKRLTVQDWSELANTFAAHADPLFDTADKTYAALYRHLDIDPGVPDDTGLSDALERFLNASIMGRH